MCGRYYLKLLAGWDEYGEITDAGWQQSFSSYNIAPSQDVPAFRMLDGNRHASMLRWGLIPFFAKGIPPSYKTVNATIERLETGDCWRGPWGRRQRCILPASGFFEWHVNDNGTKQPFAIEVTDQPVFGFAGLWDRSVREDGTAIESCTIITLPASPLMAEIHNSKRRMPAILAEGDRDAWLAGSQDQARATLRPYPDELLHGWKVSARVNAPKNNDPSLIQSLPG